PRDFLSEGTRLARRALEPYVDRQPGDWAAAPLVRDLRRTERHALGRELTELILLEVRARVALAERGGSEAERRRAYPAGIDRLDLIRRIDPPPPAAYHRDRGRLLAALGQESAAAREGAQAEAHPRRTPQDDYLLGTSLLAEGHPDAA